MKKKIVIPALIVVLLLCTAAAIVYFFDLNRFKPVISNTVKHYTGRELTINGDIRLQAHWPLTLTVEDVAWQNASWGSRPHMVRAKRAAFAVSIMSLLRGEFRFFKIRLQEPEVILEFNQAGVSNFLLDIPETEGKAVVPVLAFRDIFIQNGYFEYNDQRWDLNASVKVNELEADIPGLDKSIEILFEGSFRGLPCSLEGSIGPILAWIQPDKILPVDLSTRLGNASARLKGDIRNAAHFKDISLTLTANGPSTREMTGLIGRGDDPELGAFAAKVELTDRTGLLAIDNLAVNIGSLEQVSLSASGRIGNLFEMKGFDLNFGLQTHHVGNLMHLAGLPPSPFEAPLAAAVTLTDTADKQYSLEDFSISVGDETVQGRMDLDLTQIHPILDMHLRAKHTTLGPVTLETRMSGSFDRVSVEHLKLQMGHDKLFKTLIVGAIGNLSPLEDLSLNVTVLGNNLAHLQKITDRPLPVHGPFALSGALFMSDRHAAQVHDLKIILDKNSINGSLGFERKHEQVLWYGDLTSNRLNIERLLKPETLPDNLQKNLSSVGPSRLTFGVSGPIEQPVLDSIEFQTRIENLATLHIKGSIKNLLALAGTDLFVSLKGSDLANLKRVTGHDIPFDGPYALSCKLLNPAKKTYHIEKLKVTTDRNAFKGRSVVTFSESSIAASMQLGTKNVSLEALVEGQNAILDRLRAEKNLGPLEVKAAVVLSDKTSRLQSLDLTFGKDDFVRTRVKGSIGVLPGMQDMLLDFQVAGRNISNLESVVGQTIPVKGPYELTGEVSGHAPGNIMLHSLGLTLGGNRFTGRANLNLAGNIPVIAAEITADHFSLAPITIEELDPLKEIPDLGPLELALKIEEKNNALALTHLNFRLGRESTIITRLRGTVGNLAPLGDVFLDFEVRSQDLSIINNAYGSQYIKGRPFHIKGRLDDPQPEKITVSSFSANYGDSDLSGTATLDFTENRPSLVARLSSRRLDLRPFIEKLDQDGSPSQAPSPSPPSGKRGFSSEHVDQPSFNERLDLDSPPPLATAPSKRPGKKVFSSEHFDLTPLQQVTARVAFQGKEVLAKRMAFNDVDIRLKLRQGNLDVDPLKFRIGGGTADGTFSLHTANSPPFMATSLAVHHFDIGPMLEQLEQKSTLQGMLNTTIHLDSRGDSMAALMAELNGKIHLDIHDGQIESNQLALLERYFGSNVLDVINPFVKRPPYTTINCLITTTSIKNGQTEFNMVLDTEQTALASAGAIDLKTERLDIGIKPSPKKGFGDANVGHISFSLSNLSQPFGLGGTLARPQLVLDPTRTVVTAAKFSGAVLLGPIGITLFFSDISLGNKNICEEATQAMRKK